MFRADRGLPPFTSIHRVKHAALGEFDLPDSQNRTDDRLYYEAVFNHINGTLDL